MVNKITSLALLGTLLILASCEKQEFPVSTPPEVVFKLQGSIDGEPWSHDVGLDGTFLAASAFETLPGREVLLTELQQIDCEDCENLSTFMVTGTGLEFEDIPPVDAEEMISAGASFDLNFSDNETVLNGEFGEVLDEDWTLFVNGSLVEDEWQSIDGGFPGDGISFQMDQDDPDTGNLISCSGWIEQDWAACEEIELEVVLPWLEYSMDDFTGQIGIPEDLGPFDFVVLTYTAEVLETVILQPGESHVYSEDEILTVGSFNLAYFQEGQDLPTMILDLFTFSFESIEVQLPPFELFSYAVFETPTLQVAMAIDDGYYSSSGPCWLPIQEQPVESYFEILENEVFAENEWGQQTRKITFAADILLFDNDDVLAPPKHVIIEEGVIAFALPD